MFQSVDPLQRRGWVVVGRFAMAALVAACVGMPVADADMIADAGAAGGLTADVCATVRLADTALQDTQVVPGDDLARIVCGVTSRGAAAADGQVATALRAYLAGHPMAAMADALATQDPTVAAYMVAMAKQESNWGRHVPTLAGVDCYNYWGYRAQRARMGTGGHTCFDSPEDAVATVGARVHTLVYDQGRTTARSLLIWKCGSSCATHDAAGVERWVSVVGRYYTTVTDVIAAAQSLPQGLPQARDDRRLSLAR